MGNRYNVPTPQSYDELIRWCDEATLLVLKEQEKKEAQEVLPRSTTDDVVSAQHRLHRTREHHRYLSRQCRCFKPFVHRDLIKTGSQTDRQRPLDRYGPTIDVSSFYSCQSKDLKTFPSINQFSIAAFKTNKIIIAVEIHHSSYQTPSNQENDNTLQSKRNIIRRDEKRTSVHLHHLECPALNQKPNIERKYFSVIEFSTILSLLRNVNCLFASSSPPVPLPSAPLHDNECMTGNGTCASRNACQTSTGSITLQQRAILSTFPMHRKLPFINIQKAKDKLSSASTSTPNRVQYVLEIDNSEDQQPNQECTICMDRKVAIVLPCTHAICENCSNKWVQVHSSCPFCRLHMNGSVCNDPWQLETWSKKDSEQELKSIQTKLDKLWFPPMAGRSNLRDASSFPDDSRRKLFRLFKGCSTYIHSVAAVSASEGVDSFLELLPSPEDDDDEIVVFTVEEAPDQFQNIKVTWPFVR